MAWSEQDIEKLRMRDNLLRDQYKKKRQRTISKLEIQRNNIRLVRKIFVDMYEKQYVQKELKDVEETY